MADRCATCGTVIPEGQQVCRSCMEGVTSMLKVVLNASVNDCKEFKYNNATARIVGSKIVVEDGNQCVLITEFGNIRELVKINS